MFWTIALIVAVVFWILIAVIIRRFGHSWDTVEWDCCIFTGFVATIIAGLIFCSVVWGVSPTKIVEEHFPIVSIDRSDSVTGNFFLGSGSVNGVPHYFYYIKSGDNSYYLWQYPASGTRVIEDSSKEAGVYSTARYTMYPEWFSQPGRAESDIRFIVPKGTIIREYKLK